MIQEDDIVIRIRMAGDGSVDAKAMIEALDIAEGALYASDRNDVEQAARVLLLPAYVRDASLERLRHHRHQRLLIEDAQTGSIVLVTVVAAVSLFVLEKTVGEAFADGFKETKAYGELRDFFRGQIDAKTLFIAEALRRAFGGRKREVSVQVDPRFAAWTTCYPNRGPHSCWPGAFSDRLDLGTPPAVVSSVESPRPSLGIDEIIDLRNGRLYVAVAFTRLVAATHAATSLTQGPAGVFRPRPAPLCSQDAA